MTATLSLRLRLTMIILVPLLGISLLIGAWAVRDANARATDRFDRSLLSAVLAVSRDVAVSGGDALSPETNELLQDTSGGPVFYHVYAPDGVFVTGYATPPVQPNGSDSDERQQTYYEATYQGRDVRVLRFRDAMQIDGLIGDFTFTVWQDTRLRDAIVQDLSRRTFNVMLSLVTALALIVWFGVRLGLGPLTDLQTAIARRSSDELSPISRPVPQEVKGIVTTLNHLLGQVEASLKAKDDFISNAAHQLRNPIAGILSMAEAVRSAKSFEDMKGRSTELVAASKHASELANKLLAFERAKASPNKRNLHLVDLMSLAATAVGAFNERTITSDVTLTFDESAEPIHIRCDKLLIGEAITNLIDNALVHGGDTLSEISVCVAADRDVAKITVEDDGKGLDSRDVALALERFGQLEPSSGSGLGLAIANAIAVSHGGVLSLNTQSHGLSATITLPLLKA